MAEVEEVKDEKKNETKQEGGEPEWVQKLQTAMNNLTEKLTETKPEETEPVIQVPVPPTPQPEELTEVESEQEVTEVEPETKPKKRKFLDWLL